MTRQGNLIVAINGQVIDNAEDSERVVRDLKPGAAVKVKVQCYPNELEVAATVGGV